MDLDNNNKDEKVYRRVLKTDELETPKADTPVKEMMSFSAAISTCFNKYVEFNGRATRAEFWWFMLFCYMVQFGLNIITPLLSSLASLVFLLPMIAVSIRRLHDINRSGWNYLFSFMPLFGWIVLTYLYVQPSAEDNNAKGIATATLFIVNLIVSVVLVGSVVIVFERTGFFQLVKNIIYFDEVKEKVHPYMLAVNNCIISNGTVAGCNAGSNDIPMPITNGKGAVSSLSVTDGVILVVPEAYNNVLITDTIILTPSLVPYNKISWVASGEAVMKNYIDRDELSHEGE